MDELPSWCAWSKEIPAKAVPGRAEGGSLYAPQSSGRSGGCALVTDTQGLLESLARRELPD
jgi:hypothetical protein